MAACITCGKEVTSRKYARITPLGEQKGKPSHFVCLRHEETPELPEGEYELIWNPPGGSPLIELAQDVNSVVSILTQWRRQL